MSCVPCPQRLCLELEAGDHRERVGLVYRGQQASRLTVSCRALLTAGNCNLF